MKTKTDKETLSAVHDTDFVGFLQRINVFGDIVAGHCNCYFCQKQITVDNISNVFSEKGKAKFVCDELQCVVRLGQYMTRKK